MTLIHENIFLFWCTSCKNDADNIPWLISLIRAKIKVEILRNRFILFQMANKMYYLNAPQGIYQVRVMYFWKGGNPDHYILSQGGRRMSKISKNSVTYFVNGLFQKRSIPPWRKLTIPSPSPDGRHFPCGWGMDLFWNNPIAPKGLLWVGGFGHKLANIISHQQWHRHSQQ